jgi:hypothetical protein
MLTDFGWFFFLSTGHRSASVVAVALAVFSGLE